MCEKDYLYLAERGILKIVSRNLMKIINLVATR